MGKRGQIPINMETVDIDRVKDLAVAVVKQADRDYKSITDCKDKRHITDNQLDFFGRYSWVWDVLDVDGTYITDEIKRQGRGAV